MTSLSEYQVKCLKALNSQKRLTSLEWIMALGKPLRDPTIQILRERGLVKLHTKRNPTAVYWSITSRGRKALEDIT